MSSVELSVNTIEPTEKFDICFHKFFQKLNIKFGPAQKRIKELRKKRLEFAHNHSMPIFLPSQQYNTWKVELPDWMKDQRNQMTGPADNGELIVKLLNSGAPGVMLDLEDSMANESANLLMAHDLIKMGLYGTLTYTGKDYKKIQVKASTPTVVFIRPRGLHMDQVVPTQTKKSYRCSATIFDLAQHFYDLDLGKLKHPPCIYIPKSESAQEASWWREIFTYIEKLRKWKHGTIKCMALVESHPLAFEMEEFLYNLRPYIVGLNLGRWDYMASLIHFKFMDQNWILPDRNSIPTDIPFFQKLRKLMVNVCHKHGALAIGGMTALFPSRTDKELNDRAIDKLMKDKINEASIGMDGAWTGHPDQNEIAMKPFVIPNQINFMHENLSISPEELREAPQGIVSENGTMEAIRTCLKYRIGVAQGKGAVLIDGYMEDLATDRIYRLMLGQRLRHGIVSLQRFEELFNKAEEEVGEILNINVKEIASITKNLIYDCKFNPE